MNTMMKLIAVTCLFAGSALATNEALSSFTSIRAMEKVFHRSEKVHQSSMDAISQSLNLEKAMTVLQKSNKTSAAALLQVTNVAKNTNLRKQPKGYSGIEGARKMLNDMIYESSAKYDDEIAKCTEFYSQQCGLMQVARGEIAASNYIAASSRMHILDSQGSIGRCEEDIPVIKLELRNHNNKCSGELRKMNFRLKIIMEDIAVMTMILKMTDCNAKKLLMQVGLMKCQDQCSKASFISFKHEGLQQQMNKLQSGLSQSLTKDTMSDLFQGVEGLETMEFTGQEPELPPMNKTPMALAKPPMPRTEVPANPCNDPNQGAPSAATKRAAKCTIAKSPQCYKLQERFLLIQSGIQDERDELLEQIQKMEHACEETKSTLETQAQNDADMLANAETKLAAATESEANAGESARQTSKQFNGMNTDLLETMKTCNTNYVNFETELCALKKIRGELYKMQGGGMKKSFFVDCQLTKWDMEECTKHCGGGTQKLIRSVVTHPNRGAKCLPTTAIRSCNNDPCPVDCKLHSWGGWSKCSAQCGGGVEQRLRDVKMAMRFGGKPCGQTSETKACNAQACEKDCTLSRWTKWSPCSKDCDGGTKKRFRWIKDPAVGEGHCAGEWERERLQYKKCNMRKCVVAAKKKVLTCNKQLDVVMLLDGSGSLGKKGWNAEIEAAQNFISAFKGKKAKAKMSIILFSGPRTWSGVKKCVGKSKAKVDMEKCGIKTISHFTGNMKRLNQLVLGVEWPKGSTLTSLALSTAKAELALGRKSAQSVVLIFTDGRPMSYRKTYIASKLLRKSARLMWVPITARAPLKFIKACATRRWQENVVLAKDNKKLASPTVINHVLANMCPKPPARKTAAIALE